MAKLDSETLYRCRAATGLSEPYTTKRGTREGCPAAPVKFNVLHHFATADVRRRWEEQEGGAGAKVCIQSFEAGRVWPEGRWGTRGQVAKLQEGEEGDNIHKLDVVGYADDTTIVGRLSTIYSRREQATIGYERWGHKVHPKKWQRLWSGHTMPPPAMTSDGIVMEAKVLGSTLEAEGGYGRELQQRLARAGRVWHGLMKQIDRARMSLKTKGRLFKAAVMASLLYGTEARGVPAWATARMQVFVNKCERRMYLGKGGSTKDMVGKCTQSEIRSRLGMRSVQLEIDCRMLRYVGHLVRMPADRWERRLLQGVLMHEEKTGPTSGKDQWWAQMGRLVKEVMQHHSGEGIWHEVAQDREVWRRLQRKWADKRAGAEGTDTQQYREERWAAVAGKFHSQALLDKLWKTARIPNGAGSPLEGKNSGMLQRIIVAGGVHPGGWVVGAPGVWRDLCSSDSAKMWLHREGCVIRRRVLGKGWAQFLAELPDEEVASGGGGAAPAAPPPPPPPPPQRRIRGKQPPTVALAPPPAPPPPPVPIPPPPRRRIMGKQKLPEFPPPPVPPDDALDPPAAIPRVSCEHCGLVLRPGSMAQHLRYYCPHRLDGRERETRGARKVLRPPPPSEAAVPPPPPVPDPKALEALGPMPAVHVRWAAPKPQPPRRASSIPGGDIPAPSKAWRGPSQAPPPPPAQMGCYATCGRCNQCSACRRRQCNGGCVGCQRCRACRTWGERLAAGEPAATAKHAEMVALPPVVKRGPKDPGNIAKRAAAQAARRPAEAPAGSLLCPYCNIWLPHAHRENCPSMPFEIWAAATRQRQIQKHGQATVDSWGTQCQHCATPFPSGASKRVHLAGCERRRTAEGLPLNQFPATRG